MTKIIPLSAILEKYERLSDVMHQWPELKEIFECEIRQRGGIIPPTFAPNLDPHHNARVALNAPSDQPPADQGR